MKTNTFTKILPFGSTAYTYWISGIYKIVSYDSGEYLAYFIPEHFNNWGNSVGKGTKQSKHGNTMVYPTLKAAQDACKEHSKGYTASTGITELAAKIKTSLMQQALEYANKAA